MTPDGTGTTQRDADNALRYPGQFPGHVESHFVKANSPDGERAIWIKHTLLVPEGRPDKAVAEVWAIAFADRGARKSAAKRTFPRAALEAQAAPFALRVPCAQLDRRGARGALDGLAWDFALEPRAATHRPFAYERMYTGKFPRSKTLTPIPDARVQGTFQAFGEAWDLTGWRAAQGHNWGASHAHAYAWVHGNAWTREGDTAPLEGTWFEALSGRVRLGRGLITPWLSVAGLSLYGEVHRFDRLRALTARRVRVDARSYAFELRQADARIIAEFTASSEQLAGLSYQDPDGRVLACLNSKLAKGRLTFTRGSTRVVLHTDQAALELGTREANHGIELLV